MHPAEFVFKMLKTGRKAEIVEMLDRFEARLRQQRTPEHRRVYSFCTIFLFTVQCQLNELPLGESLESDPVLRIWSELAYFGIDRLEIAEHLENHPL